MWKLIKFTYSYDYLARWKFRLARQPFSSSKPAMLEKIKFSLGRMGEVFFTGLQDDFTRSTSSFFPTCMHPVDTIFMNNFDNFTMNATRINPQIK